MKILDVGGAINTKKDATHIIDIIEKPKDCKLHYTQQNICKKWPFKDKEFDLAYCSNVLEDIKDPLFVCKEMMRVSKAGIIIVPSILTECTKGVDTWKGNESYAGFCHHRWLCMIDDNKITFIPKWSIVNITDWTKHIPKEIKKQHFYDVLQWTDSFKIQEMEYITWEQYYNFLKDIFNYNIGENNE